MKWTPGGSTEDIEDRRGQGGGGFRGGPIGIGVVLVLLVLSLLTGRNFLSLLDPNAVGGTEQPSSSGPVSSSPDEDRLVQFVTFVINDALNFMLDLATSLALLPYLLAAAYALKLGLTGESYEGVSAGVRRRETIVAGVATAYTIFLFDAAGMKFVLLMTVILAPASMLYIKARSEHGRRLFTPAEIALFALIVAGGAIGVIGLWTGRISL